jgi:hypothetical protein
VRPVLLNRRRFIESHFLKKSRRSGGPVT